MNSLFKIKSKRTIIGVIVAFSCILLCYITNSSVKYGLFFALLFLIGGIINFRETKIKNTQIVYSYIFFLFTSILTLFLSQFIQNESMLSLPKLQIILGLVCCLVPMLILFFITMKVYFSGLLISGLILLLSTANHYVYSFRGSELCPADFFTIKTAINVVDKYTYLLPGQILYSWMLFIAFAFFVIGFPTLEIEKKLRFRIETIILILLCGGIFTVESHKIIVQRFLHGGSYYNGYLLNFTLEMREIHVRKPKNYSKKSIRKIAEKYTTTSNDSEGDTPDIIVIMDEAYADLSVLGDTLSTNIDVSPFIKSLKKNTTYGYALSSVYGGGTPNSEYEFLTGNSLLFVNGVVYQQYLKEPSYSIVSALKNKSYKCIAMHPYLETGWLRNKVWPNLLFDDCLFLDDFPQQKLVRGLVSDKEMFEVLLEKYKNHCASEDNPAFYFCVSMQNHSSYDYEGKDFKNTVTLNGYEGQYPEVEQYLSLINETDAAVEFLLGELEKIDRDVVVVFYGDHQPAVKEDFIREIHGCSLETLDEKQLLQKVPFFIWTNYESDSVNKGLTSLNYLSNYLFEKAEMELPPYNRFLKDVESVIPVLNSHGYYSLNANGFLEYSDAEGKEKEWLDKYWMVEYNSLMDLKNRDERLFPLYKKE